MVGLFLSVAPLPSAALALLLVCGVVTTGESSVIYLYLFSKKCGDHYLFCAFVNVFEHSRRAG